MWKHYKSLRQPAEICLSNVWKAWRSHAAFQQASRVFRREARHRRRLLAEEILSSSAENGIGKDASKWHQQVRKLCPKHQGEAIHLRSPEGKLLSLKTRWSHFFSQLFWDPSYKTEPLPPVKQVLFMVEEIRMAILALPCRRASLPEVAPATA